MTDPHVSGMSQKSPFSAKSDMEGCLLLVLQSRLDHRGLPLTPQPSRCVNRHQIDEFSFTDDKGAKPGSPVDRLASIGFAETRMGSVILVGDEIFYNGALIGHVDGFDETHMPTHYNIFVHSAGLKTGRDPGMALGGRLRFHEP